VQKSGRTDLNDLPYMSYEAFLHTEMPFGGHDDCTCIKIFSGINFC